MLHAHVELQLAVFEIIYGSAAKLRFVRKGADLLVATPEDAKVQRSYSHGRHPFSPSYPPPPNLVPSMPLVRSPICDSALNNENYI